MAALVIFLSIRHSLGGIPALAPRLLKFIRMKQRILSMSGQCQ
jgi:hypothetical protein